MDFMNMILGIVIILTNLRCFSLNEMFTDAKDFKCGQTPCKSPGYCCPKHMDCCCESSAGGWSFSCNRSTSWSMPWWGAVLIITALVAIIVAIVFVCYRRRKRQTYGQI